MRGESRGGGGHVGCVVYRWCMCLRVRRTSYVDHECVGRGGGGGVGTGDLRFRGVCALTLSDDTSAVCEDGNHGVLPPSPSTSPSTSTSTPLNVSNTPEETPPCLTDFAWD